MSRLIRPFLVLLACLLVGLLILGWQGGLRQKQVKAGLEGQITIATHLKELREAAQPEGNDALLTALDASLDQLAPAAQDYAQPASVEPLPQQLEASAGALVEFGIKTSSTTERAQALTAVAQIWKAAREAGIADRQYPAVLSQKMNEVQTYTCARPKDDAPETSQAVAQMQSALSQLNYVSEVYTARAGSGYSSVQARAKNLAQQSTAVRDMLTPLLLCENRLEAVQPSYPLVAPDQADRQLSDLTGALADDSLAIVADPAVSVDEDTLEVAALALALRSWS